MAFLQKMRSPSLSFLQTVVSLLLSTLALVSSFWCSGKQKVPKPLCSATKHTNCIPVPGLNNYSNVQFFWETGDDRFVFPTFHTGLFFICEENIYADGGEEKCREFYTLPPGSEKGWFCSFFGLFDLFIYFLIEFLHLASSSTAIMWLSLTLELMYIGLLLISCMLLSVQLCIKAWFPSTLRWGQLLNCLRRRLHRLLGMVGHMMYMQVFQTTVTMGPENFKPHSYGYSWAFYVAWVAFTVCMAAGVSTLNNYTKKVLMVGPRRSSSLNPCSFNFVGLLPPAPYYTPPNPAITLAPPQSAPLISHLSPYYEPPSEGSPPSPRRLMHSNSFPPPPTNPAPSSPFHRMSLHSPSALHAPPRSVHLTLPGQNHLERDEEYSPL
ncbi:Germ cell-specific gene 1-like protein [Oryzias melastigma]|uniref:Germ cell-specific gene 1-like protein n=1 Tax=Oryzias melastigma TaxID=30732 RepID=A0A834F661_ORYME|nr:Germ cell-specific gene 1-like protein [Oryzias melastigma]